MSASGDGDECAGMGVLFGIVMSEGYSQRAGDVVECVGWMFWPGELGDDFGAEIIGGGIRKARLIEGAADDAHVEGGVVRDEWTGYLRPEGGPELGEGRSVGNVGSCNAVDRDIEWIEMAGIGPDELMKAVHNLTILDHHQADGANGTTVSIGCFEINSGEVHDESSSISGMLPHLRTGTRNDVLLSGLPASAVSVLLEALID